MLAKKKKFGKKNIKEDKLVALYSKTLQYFEVYKNQVYAAAAVIVILIAAIVYFAGQSKTKQIEATAALSKASQQYHSSNFNAVIQGSNVPGIPSLAEVADKYSGTEAGEIARIFLANSYFYTGDVENALKHYKKYSGSNKLYKASSLAGMAACYEANGEFEKAAKYFRDAANTYSNNVLNSQYLLSSAINYIKTNDYKSAKSLLETLKDQYAQSQEARDADRYLAEIEIKLNS